MSTVYLVAWIDSLHGFDSHEAINVDLWDSLDLHHPSHVPRKRVTVV